MSKDLEALKTEIADDSAVSAVECECEFEPREGGGWWYDTQSIDDLARDEIERALNYLDLRGLVTRKEGAPHLVTFHGPCGTHRLA